MSNSFSMVFHFHHLTVTMKFSILIIVLFISLCVAHNYSPVYNTICKRTGGSITCYQNTTWGFDERTRTCYPVRMNIEPCGFFDGEKGCKDFCLAVPKRLKDFDRK